MKEGINKRSQPNYDFPPLLSQKNNNNNNHNDHINVKDSHNQILNLDVDLYDDFEERKDIDVSIINRNESENLILKQQEE